MNENEWAYWIAVAALIAGAGRFVDEYHLRAVTKSLLRDKLIHAFFLLEARKIPDVGGFVLSPLRKAFTLKRVLLSASFLFGLSAASVVVIAVRSKTQLSTIWEYSLRDLSPMMWLALLSGFAVPAVGGGSFLAYFFHHASTTDRDFLRVGLLALGILAATGMAVLGATFGATILDSHSLLLSQLLLFSALAGLAIPICIAAVTVLLVVVRIMIGLVRISLLRIFDVASSPAVSPFTYASALIGVLILLFKVVQFAFNNS
ncbi:MAG: hypothetical protein QOH06_2914 [Acidobacteriota bacterium]|jgi:hypothetical protein|nr:hypothetical protein [Acidobacteriota bacterium]